VVVDASLLLLVVVVGVVGVLKASAAVAHLSMSFDSWTLCRTSTKSAVVGRGGCRASTSSSRRKSVRGDPCQNLIRDDFDDIR
jgi:hypothetical protein